MFVNKLCQKYEKQVWELLKCTDCEFVPYLSSRESTTQRNLLENQDKIGMGPKQYFENMKKQHFLLYVENEKVLGFVSYIPNHILMIPGMDKLLNTCYITTVIVAPECRGRGITEQMYREMLKYNDLPLSTRTWSTNYSHIHILEKLNFKLIATLKNDRGESIDTVYYIKK